jgi:hypothetical protein
MPWLESFWGNDNEISLVYVGSNLVVSLQHKKAYGKSVLFGTCFADLV